MSPDELSDRLMEVAVRVGKVVDALPPTRLGKHVAGQLVRSGTASGPNYEESRSAESKKDFIHKIGISLKELRETRYWLRFSIRAELIAEQRLKELIVECDELIKILAKSVSTAKHGRVNESSKMTND